MTYRMNGNTIELIKYIVRWNENIPLELEKENKIQRSEYCIDDSHLALIEDNLKERKIKYTIEIADNKGFEWLNGIEIMNEETLQQIINFTPEEVLEYRRNIAYMTWTTYDDGVPYFIIGNKNLTVDEISKSIIEYMYDDERKEQLSALATAKNNAKADIRERIK